MDDLIEALMIFRKYLANTNAHCPTNTSHDTLHIVDVDVDQMLPEDIRRLDQLGFFPDSDGAFISFRFGSA